jgi:hypothetical protein
MPSLNFVILIGGPGKVAACDAEHDQTWKNYIAPIQVEMNHKISLPGERVQWWVYAPAYRERWLDDSKAKATQIQRKEVAAIRALHANDYLDRIRNAALSAGAAFKALEQPQDFWVELSRLPDGSLSRLWYIGHASDLGLMLKLIHDVHDVPCSPLANVADMILRKDIANNESLIGRKFDKHGQPSKFLGCTTRAFAEQWRNTFHVTAEGATAKIDFSVTNRPSKIADVIERLEKSEPTTGWTSFPSAGR